MQFLETSIEDYRNISFASIIYRGAKVFILGPNGQGKTNLLESMGLVTALRSFRTSENRSLVQWKSKRAGLRFKIRLSGQDTQEITLYIHSSGRKEVFLNGDKVSRFSDFVGRFPVVICSSEDIQLLRGAPKNRRQFMDLLFSATDPEYLDALRTYHRILSERNSLLKNNSDDHQLSAFERLMAAPAITLTGKRREGLANVEATFKEYYDRLSPSEEKPVMQYIPDCELNSEPEYLDMLKQNRERDRVLKTTSRGIHRDDFRFGLQDHRARQFASEGQQRSMVISLRLAQLGLFEKITGIMPVLIVDDILGELDSERRSAFWEIMAAIPQVFVSGTHLPVECQGENWQIIHVNEGKFTTDDNEIQALMP